MKTIKGPALFLAQFVSDDAPFNTLENIAEWAGSLGFKGVQIPTWDIRLFDLDKAASDKAYCLQVQGILDKQTSAWGIKVANVELKHVDLNQSMIRAIAKQAEAERERRAPLCL